MGCPSTTLWPPRPTRATISVTADSRSAASTCCSIRADRSSRARHRRCVRNATTIRNRLAGATTQIASTVAQVRHKFLARKPGSTCTTPPHDGHR